MKKSFYFGMCLIIFLILALLSYGVYLNERSENQISSRMLDMRVQLRGSKAEVRDIFPSFGLDLMYLVSDNIVDVPALIDGRVEKHFVSPQSLVRVGQPIAEIVNEEIPLKIQQVESDILEAEANLMRCQNIYNRYSELVESDGVSKLQFDEATADFKAAEARLANCKAQKAQLEIQSRRQVITAPISGEVLKFYRQEGAYLRAGQPLALVGEFDTLYFKVEYDDKIARQLIEEKILKLSFNEEAKFTKVYGESFASGNQGAKQIFNVNLREVDPPISQGAEKRQLTFEVDNRVGLLEPGFYAGGNFQTSYSKKCLTIPLTATVDDTHSSVRVVEDGILKIRKIVAGADDGKYLEIISGLSEGDIVVTSDTEGLKEGTKVEITLEGGAD